MSEVFPIGFNEHTSRSLVDFYTPAVYSSLDQSGTTTSNVGKYIGQQTRRTKQFKALKGIENQIKQIDRQFFAKKITHQEYEKQIKSLKETRTQHLQNLISKTYKICEKYANSLGAHNENIRLTDQILNMQGGNPSLATYGKETNIGKDNYSKEYLVKLGLPR